MVKYMEKNLDITKPRYSEEILGPWLYRSSTVCRRYSFIHLAPVVQKVDNAIDRINLFPLDSAIGFPNTYPLDGNLSGGQRYPKFEQPGPGKTNWSIVFLSKKRTPWQVVSACVLENQRIFEPEISPEKLPYTFIFTKGLSGNGLFGPEKYRASHECICV